VYITRSSLDAELSMIIKPDLFITFFQKRLKRV